MGPGVAVIKAFPSPLTVGLVRPGAHPPWEHLLVWVLVVLTNIYGWKLCQRQNALAYLASSAKKKIYTKTSEAVFLVVCDPSMNEL